MNARNAFNPDLDERAEFPKLKQRFNEDPARFLQSSKDLAFARIRGIRDPELLNAYSAVAKQILSGTEQTKVLEAIDDRERELAGEPIAADPEPTPVPATDGGTVESPAEPEGSEAEPDELHPDVRGLEAGQVLVLERDESTEYIFPALPDADEPFLCRSFDSEGDERTAEPIPLSLGEVASRPINDTDPVPADSIDKRAPNLAATNGGDSQ